MTAVFYDGVFASSNDIEKSGAEVFTFELITNGTLLGENVGAARFVDRLRAVRLDFPNRLPS